MAERQQAVATDMPEQQGCFLDQVTPLILTFDEAPNLPRTLAKLDWARRIVVVDSGSTDGTLELLAADPRVEVFHRPFDHFAHQCNFGLEHIATKWVLSLDADYVLSDRLIAEMRVLRPPDGVEGYEVGFVYVIFGRALRGTVYPSRTVLHRRSAEGYRVDGHGHRIALSGPVGKLENTIGHDDRKPLGRWFRSQIGYALAEAEHISTGNPSELSLVDRLRAQIWLAPLLVLPYTLIVRGCILDGFAGLYYAFQRTLAELMLAIALLDRRLRR